MSEKYIRAEELAEIMEISVPYAYKIIKQLNAEREMLFDLPVPDCRKNKTALRLPDTDRSGAAGCFV